MNKNSETYSFKLSNKHRNETMYIQQKMEIKKKKSETHLINKEERKLNFLKGKSKVMY